MKQTIGRHHFAHVSSVASITTITPKEKRFQAASHKSATRLAKPIKQQWREYAKGVWKTTS
eukprot:6282318-Amphidinium_carterae.1